MSRARPARPTIPVSPAIQESGVAEGWVVTRLPGVCAINPPKPPTDLLSPDAPVTFVPMPAVDAEQGAIVTPTTRPFGEVRRGFTAFRNDDVIMAKITPCMENGKAAIAHNLENGLGFGSTEFHVLRSNGAVLPEYLFHFIRQESFRKAAESEMTGSVGQKRVPVTFLEEVDLPLPPLAEQRRIVAKVEELLARVTAAQERLERVPNILKRFRQAVLAAACSGRLTHSWRLQHCDSNVPDRQTLRGPSNDLPNADEHLEGHEFPESWIRCRVDAIVTIQNGRAFPSKEYDERGIRLLRPGNLHASGRVEWNQANTACLPSRWSGNFPEYVLGTGELLMNLTAQSLRDEFLGRVCLKLDNTPALLNQRIARFQVAGSYDVRPYLFVYFRARFFRAFVSGLDTGSLIRHMHSKDVARHVLPLPPPQEQAEIVRRVGSLLAVVDVLQERLGKATVVVEGQTRAILSKAFRGELVPTEAELARAKGCPYESASALLARVARGRVTGASLRDSSTFDTSGHRKEEKPLRKRA